MDRIIKSERCPAKWGNSQCMYTKHASEYHEAWRSSTERIHWTTPPPPEPRNASDCRDAGSGVVCLIYYRFCNWYWVVLDVVKATVVARGVEIDALNARDEADTHAKVYISNNYGRN